MSEITLVLQAIGRGENRASEELLPLVYDELRRLAAARMARESAGHTLQPTALVHEAWLKMRRCIEHRCSVARRFSHFPWRDFARDVVLETGELT